MSVRSNFAAVPNSKASLWSGVVAVHWLTGLRFQPFIHVQHGTAHRRVGAHRRYNDAVLALSKAVALAAASDDATTIRDAVASYAALADNESAVALR